MPNLSAPSTVLYLSYLKSFMHYLATSTLKIAGSILMDSRSGVLQVMQQNTVPPAFTTTITKAFGRMLRPYSKEEIYRGLGFSLCAAPLTRLIMSNNKSNSAKTAKQLLQERQVELAAEVERLEQAVCQEEEEDRQCKEEENKRKAEER
ncbi:hypothetical protein EDB19DRAFT_1918984 [Suillus lakei]|nr:hypothetical protein EDB19DRAFT_1918984 [Suillus lakei]